jgi:DNA mismatch repair ATPase MutS
MIERYQVVGPSSNVIAIPSPHAGKSTVLRSVASIALLACCGLMVPAREARVPFYDAFMLRNFSGDSPLEGLSSFAMEMVDIRCGRVCCK